jgi:hypothetical protein
LDCKRDKNFLPTCPKDFVALIVVGESQNKIRNPCEFFFADIDCIDAFKLVYSAGVEMLSDVGNVD